MLQEDNQIEKEVKKTKRKVKKKKDQLIINVSDSQYPVIRYVGKKMLNWIVQTDENATNWDIWWTDGAVFSDLLGRMNAYQKVNHFPGMYSLARKNHLGRNLMKMYKQFPQAYNYFPQTWLLPAELSDFRTNVGKNRTFIIKPEASCQGKGIMLVKDAEGLSINEHYVAQRYLSKPYLIDGLKFDLRIYVLLAGCDPLRIYIFKEGLARFATETYKKPCKDNLDNICMHLTNYAVNKDNENFIFNESDQQMDIGHKRSMTSVFELLRSRGENVDQLWITIKKMMIKTFCAVQPILAHQYKSCQPNNHMNNMCFEVLGMDVILDSKLKPYLLEVNHSPSFTTDTPLDATIKRQLISQSLILMNCTQQAKQEIILQERQILQQRMLTGKPIKLTIEERQKLIRECQGIRDQYENQNLGNFEKVYPMRDYDEDYEKFIEYAGKLYEDSTGTNSKKIQQLQQQQKRFEKSEFKSECQLKPLDFRSDQKIPECKTEIVRLKSEKSQELQKIIRKEAKTTIGSQDCIRNLRFSSLKPQQRAILQQERQKRSNKVLSQGTYIIPKLLLLSDNNKANAF
ncbi:unnamed protein product [Paramecium sonneborni]|uniref:Uncharacterized protein n=1 Tax=Paramecium sonneborni TaxID=65129 RepID=A0A8S1R9Z6_9CILI|nr:unnamed protein product [Paramecium sonneborni]